MATTAKIAKETKKLKFDVRYRNRCRICGRPRGVLPQVRPLPHPSAGPGAAGLPAGRHQGELVGPCPSSEERERNEHDRPDRGPAEPDPQRPDRQARPARRADLEAQARGREAPQGRGLHQELPGDRGARRWAPCASSCATARRGCRPSPTSSGSASPAGGSTARPDEIQPVRNGLGIGIVSTSQGLLTDGQARERRVGGELLCQVW